MHTIFSSDSRVTPESLVRRCVQVGLNCIAVTDHNTIEGALAVRQISPFVVIVGEEVRSSGGEITGLFLKENIEIKYHEYLQPKYKQNGKNFLEKLSILDLLFNETLNSKKFI